MGKRNKKDSRKAKKRCEILEPDKTAKVLGDKHSTFEGRGQTEKKPKSQANILDALQGQKVKLVILTLLVFNLCVFIGLADWVKLNWNSIDSTAWMLTSIAWLISALKII
jgi:hypothetical protein